MTQESPIEFGDYTLVKYLGSGNIADVYLAHSPQSQACTVRIFNRLPEVSDGALEDYLNALATAADCRSPHVPPVIDGGESDEGVPFIVYDVPECLCPGNDVKTMGPMSESEAMELTMQVALALRNLWHGSHRVHGCIRPSNILIDGQGNVVLSDAGDSKRLLREPGVSIDDLNDAGDVADFMSTEHADDIDLEMQSDMYSLGATLFYYLTGHAPFQGDSAKAVLRARLEQEPPDVRSIRPHTSRHISKLIKQLMSFNSPFEDWDSACSAIQAVANRSAAVVSQPTSPSRSPVALWLGAGGVLLLSILVAIIVLVAKSGSSSSKAKGNASNNDPEAVAKMAAQQREDEAEFDLSIARIANKLRRDPTDYDACMKEMEALQGEAKSTRMKDHLEKGIAKLKELKAKYDASMVGMKKTKPPKTRKPKTMPTRTSSPVGTSDDLEKELRREARACYTRFRDQPWTYDKAMKEMKDLHAKATTPEEKKAVQDGIDRINKLKAKLDSATFEKPTTFPPNTQPGLWFGTLKGEKNLKTPNPRTECITNVGSKTEGKIPNASTNVFTGKFYDADGVISFTEHIDDGTRIWIDGKLVLEDDLYRKRTDTGKLKLKPGWHDIEIRLFNSHGGSGPVKPPGIGYDPDGGKYYKVLIDPGDGTFLRCIKTSGAGK